jgi:hypothetical protein
VQKYLSDYPKLVSEWHPFKNVGLNLEDYKHKSNKKVWWKCPKGEDHEWQARIYQRIVNGCPFCSGRRVSKSNNLLTMNPKLANEWHPTKNKDLKPENFTNNSNKIVWWKCPKGEDHEWNTTINNRSNGRGCPFCRGYKACKSTNLVTINPKVANEWHPTKNKDLKPENFTLKSNKKVWWKCPKGEDHEWESVISHRSTGKGCPFCDGKRVSKANNLLTMNPKLANEWHPTKNKDLKPENFTPISTKKVWWKCPKGEDHEWESTIGNRSYGNGCPFCAGSGTSQPEIRILCELKYLIGSDEVAWRHRIDGVEIDIFVSKYNLGIEFDGYHWHKGKLQSDINKNEFFKKKGIQIIRVREHPLDLVSTNDVVVKQKPLTKDDLNALILNIRGVMQPPLKINYDKYIRNSSFLNKKEFKRLISFLPSPPPEYSILYSHPEVSKQWNYEKNSPLKPQNFTHGSHQKVWWNCTRVESHKWIASIAHRTRGTNCPMCFGPNKNKLKSLRKTIKKENNFNQKI